MAPPELDFGPAPDVLGDWFVRNRRNLPWRTPVGVLRDPWKTLVSEVMSQQTRLEVVVPRFLKWMNLFPTPSALARASEEAVLSAWAGLGYYSRARNLRRAAIQVTENGWPRTTVELGKLPGLGPYTAAAVASLAFGERVAMVDGNVIRVLSRLRALATDPRSTSGARKIAELARIWVSDGDAGLWNEATMELGATVCTPRNPDCPNCPLSDLCRAAALGEPEKFPTPKPRAETVRIRRASLVVQGPDGILLRRAAQDELLRGLWILPAEGDHPDLKVSGMSWGEVRHSITRHDVRWTVAPGTWIGTALPEGWSWCPRRKLSERIVSSLPHKALALAGLAPT
jgi:A/G-specific adenine glycosylase